MHIWLWWQRPELSKIWLELTPMEPTCRTNAAWGCSKKPSTTSGTTKAEMAIAPTKRTRPQGLPATLRNVNLYILGLQVIRIFRIFLFSHYIPVPSKSRGPALIPSLLVYDAVQIWLVDVHGKNDNLGQAHAWCHLNIFKGSKLHWGWHLSKLQG